ncbi:MAG: DUF1570 domain-containing protein [Bacteroidota bacterium]
MKTQLFKKVLLIFSLLLVVTSVIHAIAFPQETRCILVDLYDFERTDNLYYRANVDNATINQLQNLIEQAEVRVADFWGEKTVEPKFIYCDTDEDYLKFGVPFLTPACANMKLGAYVVISNQGLSLDIIAHELSHTELYNRIGFFNRLRKIPTWFDEGLAMQVDWRNYYSTDSLKAKTNFENLPAITQMQNPKQFGSGTREKIMLNYSTSKYLVEQWYSKEKLDRFIDRINDGASFREAYSQK